MQFCFTVSYYENINIVVAVPSRGYPNNFMILHFVLKSGKKQFIEMLKMVKIDNKCFSLHFYIK